MRTVSRTLAFAGFVAFLALFLFMNRLWYFPEPMQLEGALAVSRRLDLAPGLACVLAKMGLVEEGQARQFLFPRLRDLRDPFEIGGIQKAVDRIFQAIDRREVIVLYGDYDVDGVTSVALLNRVMKSLRCRRSNLPATPARGRLRSFRGRRCNDALRCIRRNCSSRWIVGLPPQIGSAKLKLAGWMSSLLITTRQRVPFQIAARS